MEAIPDNEPGGADPERVLRRRRFRAVPLRVLIPNLITLLALCLGLTAIRFAFEGQIEWAVVAIAAAAVLDGLDGRIARALKGTSRFGAELDSLADFIDFGVAPAIVLYVSGLHEMRSLGWFAALVFAIACALRLARFNVMLDEPDPPAWSSQFFVGMPAPAGAIVGLLPVYLQYSLFNPPRAPAFTLLEIIYVLGVALLMASRIPHFSGKLIGRVPREYVAVVLIGLAAAVLLLANFPLQTLVALTVAYLATIPFSVRRFNQLRQADEASAAVSGAK
jgi:CDP-diacylglycerol---serine O-phosphatidyltransferase